MHICIQFIRPFSLLSETKYNIKFIFVGYWEINNATKHVAQEPKSAHENHKCMIAVQG